MKDEILAAVAFWTGKVSRHWHSRPQHHAAAMAQLDVFQRTLFDRMAKRFAAHWFPEDSRRGRGFRSVTFDHERLDECLEGALLAAAIPAKALGRNCCCLFVDPGRVAVRYLNKDAGGSAHGDVLWSSNAQLSPAAQAARAKLAAQQSLRLKKVVERINRSKGIVSPPLSPESDQDKPSRDPVALPQLDSDSDDSSNDDENHNHFKRSLFPVKEQGRSGEGEAHKSEEKYVPPFRRGGSPPPSSFDDAYSTPKKAKGSKGSKSRGSPAGRKHRKNNSKQQRRFSSPHRGSQPIHVVA